MNSIFIKTGSGVRLILTPDTEEERAMLKRLENSRVSLVTDNLKVFDENVSGGLLIDENNKARDITPKEADGIN